MMQDKEARDGVARLEEAQQQAGQAHQELEQAVAELGKRLIAAEQSSENLEARLSDLSANTPDTEPDPVLKDRVADLEQEVARFTSPEYHDSVVENWLGGLTEDSYYALGIKLGFLEKVPEASESEVAHAEAETNPDGDIVLADSIPEGEEKLWQYSETFGQYVKLVAQ